MSANSSPGKSGNFATKAKQFRDWVNRRSALVSLLALIAVALALAFLVNSLLPDSRKMAPPNENAYFFDLTTEKLFVAPAWKFPPIPVPGAKADAPPMGAMAYVFSCGGCERESDRFVGYLEVFSVAAKDKLDAELDAAVAAGAKPLDAAFALRDGLGNDKTIQSAHRVSLPKGPKNDKVFFVTADSPEGYEVLRAPNERCGENGARPCLPSRQ